MRCPHCEYKDGGPFSWAYYCTVTGAKVGDENNRQKVEYLCNPRYGCRYVDECPIYKKKHG